MRTIAALMLVLGMAGCTTQGATCSGWTKGPQPNDAVRMVQAERRLSEWLVGHNEYGTKVGCW